MPSDRAAAQAAKRPGAPAVNFKISSATENYAEKVSGRSVPRIKKGRRFMGLWLGTSSTT